MTKNRVTIIRLIVSQETQREIPAKKSLEAVSKKFVNTNANKNKREHIPGDPKRDQQEEVVESSADERIVKDTTNERAAKCRVAEGGLGDKKQGYHNKTNRLSGDPKGDPRKEIAGSSYKENRKHQCQ